MKGLLSQIKDGFNAKEEQVELEYPKLEFNYQLLDDRFRLLKELGSGTFGSVYLAYDIQESKLVAVKRGSAKAKLSIKKDVLRTNALLEGNANIKIPKIHYVHSEFQFYACDLLGPTLDEVKIDEISAAHIAIQMLHILEDIHDQGWVHNDIKPSNICINREERRIGSEVIACNQRCTVKKYEYNHRGIYDSISWDLRDTFWLPTVLDCIFSFVFQAREISDFPRTILAPLAKRVDGFTYSISNDGLLSRETAYTSFPDISLTDDGIFTSVSSEIVLIDLGLMKKWREDDGSHRQMKGARRVGTRNFASLNVHDRWTTSRRDDLESLAYTLIYLLNQSHPDSVYHLPWYVPNDNGDAKNHLWNQTGKKKREADIETLCEYIMWEVFAEFLKYCRGLEYEERPDYEMWRSKFADGLKHLEMQNQDTSCFWMCVGDAELTPDILIRKRRQNIEFDALFVSIYEQAPGCDLGP